MAILWRAVDSAITPRAWTVFKRTQAVVDRYCRDRVKPRRGSILYCCMGLVEHTGIYVGDNRIVNMSGDGLIESTTPHGFVEGKAAPLGNIYVSCQDDHAVGTEAVAQLAEAAVGESVDYKVLSRNCHRFVVACLMIADLEEKDSLDASTLNECAQKLKRNLRPHIKPHAIFHPGRLHAVKTRANEILRSNTWRVWDV